MNQFQIQQRFTEDDVQVLRAIAHPIRLRLVKELLDRGVCNVTQLQEVLQIPQSTVSQHLTKLKQSRVVQFERRGLEVYYHVSSSQVQAVVHTLFS